MIEMYSLFFFFILFYVCMNYARVSRLFLFIIILLDTHSTVGSIKEVKFFFCFKNQHTGNLQKPSKDF
jgi:hypothetical protein